MTSDECAAVKTLDYPIYSDGDILDFEDVGDRLPLGIERDMKLFGGPMKGDWRNGFGVRELQNLPFGLPDECEPFRRAPFTGEHHAFAFVPHVSKYQFLGGSGAENTWVRFDKPFLKSFDHDRPSTTFQPFTTKEV
ncbi:unnamed protein product [Prorocentrum cordatum]|uniref:Mannosyltransferase n=1 Tax=Prorocentrum cordatum TaxID=2364126 RepID=A0ABN9UYD7_9DINO|nr:unnamed protein product [Polarella glacialis]